MGCGSSKTSAKVVSQASLTPENSQQLGSNGRNGLKSENNARPRKEISLTSVKPAQETRANDGGKIDEEKSKEGVADNNNIQTFSEQQANRTPEDKVREPICDKPKGVAFDISLAVNDSNTLPRRPHKLKRLESAPTLTAEMLAQKMAAAEDKRQKELEKKAKKTSKRRKELLMAQEMDNAQQQMADKMVHFEEKMMNMDKNRAKAQAEIIAKQKKREDRAKKVRDKARKIKEGDDIVHVAVDSDQTYNADVDEGDGWESDAARSHTSSENEDDLHPHNGDEVIQDTEETVMAEKENNNIHDFFD